MSRPDKPKTWLFVVAGVVPAIGLISLMAYAISRGISDRALEDGGRRVAEVCASRLRKVGQALKLYSEQSDGLLPDASMWVDAAFPYGPTRKDPAGETESVFRCPTIALQRDGSYGYAFNFDFSRKPLSEAPEAKPLVFDATDLERNANGAPEVLFPIPRRHNGSRQNIAVFPDLTAGPIAQ